MQPTDSLVRAPHYRLLLEEGAVFEERAGTAMAISFGGSRKDETDQARNLGLADLTPLPRLGFKGRDCIAWAQSQGLEVSGENNRARPQQDGALAARLSDGEILILSDLAGEDDILRRLQDTWSLDGAPGCYLVPRYDTYAWFQVTGVHAAAMFAKLCAVDLRPHRFPVGGIAQTSLARMTGIIIRADHGQTLAYHLLFDSASADYLWPCLRDAMAEFGGAPIGLTALQAL